MASVRRKPLRNGKYQFIITDYTGKRRFYTGTRDKTVTLQMAQRLEDEHRQIRLGYRPIPHVEAESVPVETRPVMDEYVTWGEAQGGRDGRPWGKTHLRNRKSQLTWWREQLGETFDEIHLSAVEAQLRTLQQGRAPKTVAAYAETISAFCVWCVERGYLEHDPLKNLRQLDTTPQTYRRAMTRDEITRLFEVCSSAHRLFLETAVLTGLRANELRNLTVEHLDVVKNGLHLDAAWTKNRKPGFQPLPNGLVARLQASVGEAKMLYKKSYTRGGHRRRSIPQNPLLYVPSHPARSLDADLEAAGIPKVTPEGKLDFHAIRLAYINFVIESGVSVKEAQVLARHSTPQLTMNVYGRTRDERLWSAVEQVAQDIFPAENCALSVHQIDTEGGEETPQGPKYQKVTSNEAPERAMVRFPPPPLPTPEQKSNTEAAEPKQINTFGDSANSDDSFRQTLSEHRNSIRLHEKCTRVHQLPGDFLLLRFSGCRRLPT